MEMKPGYKPTEAGVIPEDWVVERLDACVRADAPICYGILMPGQFHAGGVPVIKVKDIIAGRINEDGLLLTKRSIDEAYKRSRLQPLDVVITIRGTTGRVAVVPPSLRNANITQDTARVRVTNRHSSRFIFAALQSKYVQDQVALHTIGQAVKGINIRDVKNLLIPLPPTRAEQDAIAEALSDADALIESLEQLVAKKRQIKHGTVQELLTGKRRLPGFNGEWRTKRLGEIGEALIGLTYTPADVREHGVLVLRSSNVFEGNLVLEDNVYVEMPIPEKIMVKPGDILICVRNGSRDLIGKCAKIDDRARGMTFGAFMAVFRTPYSDFIYYQFQSDAMQRQIHEHLGATINQITNASLNSFQVPLPLDETEQQAIAAVLMEMDADILTLEMKLTKAEQVKRGMMQELLTGRIRLL